MNFCIRDLFLVTLVVALAVGWLVDRSRLAAKLDRVESVLRSVWPEWRKTLGEDELPRFSSPAPNSPKK
jgi:hypothetical protein